jgi:hypothetical protein
MNLPKDLLIKVFERLSHQFNISDTVEICPKLSLSIPINTLFHRIAKVNRNRITKRLSEIIRYSLHSPSPNPTTLFNVFSAVSERHNIMN